MVNMLDIQSQFQVTNRAGAHSGMSAPQCTALPSTSYVVYMCTQAQAAWFVLVLT